MTATEGLKQVDTNHPYDTIAIWVPVVAALSGAGIGGAVVLIYLTWSISK